MNSFSEEFSITAPPGDGISCIKFEKSSNYSNLLLVSSWDSTTRLYDTLNNCTKATFNFKAACLACCFNPSLNNIGFAGGLDKSIKLLDLNRGIDTLVGTHKEAVSCIEYNNATNLLFSGGWDCCINGWDIRDVRENKISMLIDAKIYSFFTHSNLVVLATSKNEVIIYDIRNSSSPVFSHTYKYQIRKVASFPNCLGYVVTSIEGRVFVEHFEQNENLKNFAFKCHRKGDNAYPVNAIAFNPNYDLFATGGGDNIVNIWDRINKKKLQQLPPYHVSISSLDFNYDGSLLAIAASYGYEEGDIDHANDNIFIRPMLNGK